MVLKHMCTTNNVFDHHTNNLLIPPAHLARYFFIQGHGLTISTNIHLNLGLETILVVIVSILFEIFKSTLTIGVMSYHASVSDPIYGGVYMSLLAAFSNLGKTWPGTMSLSVLSWMDNVNTPQNSTVSNDVLEWDNYTTLSLISSLIGCIWLLVTRQLIVRYQSKTEEDFRPKKKKMILLAE